MNHYKILTSTVLITILITAYSIFNNSTDLPKPKSKKQIGILKGQYTKNKNFQQKLKQTEIQLKKK